MSVNYQFDITNVKKRNTLGDFSDVVISASYTVSAWSDALFTGTEEEDNIVITRPQFNYNSGGTISFNTESLDSSTFVSFDTITKDTVKGWILDAESASSEDDFSYVRSAVSHIRDKITLYGTEVDTTLDGDVTIRTVPEVAPAEPEPTE